MPLAELVFEGQFMGLFWVLVMCACRACFFITLPTSSWPTSAHTVVLGIQAYCELASKAYFKLDQVAFGQTVKLCLVFGVFTLVFLLSLLGEPLCTSSGTWAFWCFSTWNCSLALIKPGLLAVGSSEHQLPPRKLISFNCETKTVPWDRNSRSCWEAVGRCWAEVCWNHTVPT